MKTLFSVKIGRLAPILNGTLAKDLALSVLKEGDFYQEEKPLANALISILENGKEINAENVFLETKSVGILVYYMSYVNAIDKMKILRDTKA